jgi:hypothetical protein
MILLYLSDVCYRLYYFFFAIPPHMISILLQLLNFLFQILYLLFLGLSINLLLRSLLELLNFCCKLLILLLL